MTREEVGVLDGGHLGFEGGPQDPLVAVVEEFRLDAPSRFGGTLEADLDLEVEAAVLEVVFEGAIQLHVGDVHEARGVQVDVPMQPGHEPVVLVFEVAGVRPAHHHRGEHVLAVQEVRGQVELGGQAGVLAHAERFAVQPRVEDALGAAEVHDHAAITPLLGQAEVPAVEPGGIGVRHFRGRPRERHLDVRIVGSVPALARPVAGNHGGRPVGVLEVRRCEVCGRRLGTLDEGEAPAPVQALEEGGFVAAALQGCLGVGVGDEWAARLEPAPADQLGALPAAFGEGRHPGLTAQVAMYVAR